MEAGREGQDREDREGAAQLARARGEGEEGARPEARFQGRGGEGAAAPFPAGPPVHQPSQGEEMRRLAEAAQQSESAA